MRLAIFSIAACFVAAAPAEARLFWQTYGATVPLDGGGCAWNANQDYFVPRHCDSCRYGLFSACKTSHTTSAACANLHPIYSGYCTPYASCRYRWRDHHYKSRCGCTPLADCFGPWHLDKCRKHCFALCNPAEGYGAPNCGACNSSESTTLVSGFCNEGAIETTGEYFQNVEPIEGEVLGSVPAFAGLAGRSGAAGMSGMGGMPLGNNMSLPTAGSVSGLPLPGLGGGAPRASTGVLSVPMAPGY